MHRCRPHARGLGFLGEIARDFESTVPQMLGCIRSAVASMTRGSMNEGAKRAGHHQDVIFAPRVFGRSMPCSIGLGREFPNRRWAAEYFCTR